MDHEPGAMELNPANTPYLSVIIPAYNEALRIGATVQKVSTYLRAQSFTFEILVVDDGSTDSTVSIVQALDIPIHIVQLTKNTGKGAAVQAGMAEARGEFRLFMDADGSTDIAEVSKLLVETTQGADVVVGSRRLPSSVIRVKQSRTRDFLGWVFRKLVRLCISLPISDTQNGFKLFSARAATTIFPKITTTGWTFDIEALLIAHTTGFAIKEVPIIWSNDGRSKMRPYQMVKMLFDLLRIRATTHR